MTIQIILTALFCLLSNIPFGYLRIRQKRYSLLWFVYIHVPVPFVIMIRIFLKIDAVYIPLFIALAVAGQLIGARICKKSL